MLNDGKYELDETYHNVPEEEKGYALPYAADKRKIYRIGVNFSSESRNIAAWEVRE